MCQGKATSAIWVFFLPHKELENWKGSAKNYRLLPTVSTNCPWQSKLPLCLFYVYLANIFKQYMKSFSVFSKKNISNISKARIQKINPQTSSESEFWGRRVKRKK